MRADLSTSGSLYEVPSILAGRALGCPVASHPNTRTAASAP